jgi:hypothetical protein
MQLFTNPNFKNSFYDGMLAHTFATLTGGVFLTGLALHLGMNEVMIGLLAATPFLVTGFQLQVSYIIRKKGRRKTIAYLGAGGARLHEFVWSLFSNSAFVVALFFKIECLVVRSIEVVVSDGHIGALTGIMTRAYCSSSSGSSS